ncbi:phosphatidylinositol 4-phosphate 3-kinase C2 domain-containing subunit gamma [Columba guinea]|nr:phosphatidylinositol 4-phosphate 3-kinase C2 domain-containing subunit gamma [Columba guinea]
MKVWRKVRTKAKRRSSILQAKENPRLLKNAQNEVHFKIWYQKLLAALQFCAGKTLNNEFSKEGKLIRILEDIAKEVKAASDAKRKIGDDLRQDMLVLQIIRVMDSIWLQEGLDMQMITYRKIQGSSANNILYLTVSRCQTDFPHNVFPYELRLVQMVPDATTLAKIHRESGLIGPLKENTIKKWFRHHHPLESSYQEAIRNFFYSCAGWCVVTFILGVCDRHSDNIMLTSAGHMFHIDFGRFLGHAQTFGSIRRDRAPFIFTSEMEYFITEGGKNPQRFQEFVELCCRAYNIVRKHSQLLLNLLEMMLHAGLPELKSIQDLKYVYDNLRPQDSDLQATSYFTRKEMWLNTVLEVERVGALCCLLEDHVRIRFSPERLQLHRDRAFKNRLEDLATYYAQLNHEMDARAFCKHVKIKESLECFPVKLNNLIHTLVQMSMAASAKPPAPETDAQEWMMLDAEKSITRATILGFNKKSDPLYLVQVVQTCNVVTFVEKSFDQFSKLHSDLQKQFPLHALPE